jgi:hypothetical protein
MSTSFPLRTTALHLDGVGPFELHDATDEFWSDRTRPEFRTGHIMSAFDYTRTWNYRERHPDGDELAILIGGHVDLLTDHGTGETTTPLRAGAGSIIPAGTWHRLRVHEPSTVLFITPVPARTEHCDAPEGASTT